MKQIFFKNFQTDWGSWLVAAEEHGIVRLVLPGESSETLYKLSFGNEVEIVEKKDAPLLERAEQEIREYLAGQRKEFDLPLTVYGTSFQKKVWQALKRIPYGKTKSYGDIAKDVGRPKASRAVGGANNRNPLPLLIPCHRVVGHNGDLVGFGGGLSLKKKLLQLESQA